MAAMTESKSDGEEAQGTDPPCRNSSSNIDRESDSDSDSKWTQAVQSLSDSDRERLGIAQSSSPSSSSQDPLGVLEDILTTTEAKKEEALKKRRKMTVWINKFMASIGIEYWTFVRFLKSAAKPKSQLESEFRRLEEAQTETIRLAQLVEAQKSQAAVLAITNMTEKQSELDKINASRFGELQKALQDYERPMSRISEQLELIQDELGQESRIKILRAISTIPYATHHKVASQGRLKGSGQWLLNNSVYSSWRASPVSSVLWLHGIPGSGKTKLASLVVDDLKRAEHIAFFYCMRNPSEPLRALCQSILANLIRQLASLDSGKPLLPPVVSQYQNALDGYAGFEDQSWTVDECREVLIELLDEYPAVTIVIDALDEVDSEDRYELTEALAELLQMSKSLVKIFVSSRDNPDIALALEGSPNVYIEADDNAIDIEAFM
ncbi:hypothetical protein PG984_001454 [Apiospora sp. TS-2023a]